MPGNKYLERDAVSGRMRERLSADASSGAADAGRVVALNPSGQIDGSMLPPGVGANSISVEASEDIDANELLEIFDDAGTPKARLADASAANKFTAMGFAFNSVLAGANVTVYFEGRIGGQTGLIPGQRTYLSTVPGALTTAPLTGAGELHQFIGKAVSATEVHFEADDPIELA